MDLEWYYMRENIPYTVYWSACCSLSEECFVPGPHVPIVGLVRTQTNHPVTGVSVSAFRACVYEWSCVGMLTYQEHNGILFSVGKAKVFLKLPWTHLMLIILLLKHRFYSTISLDILIQLQTLHYSMAALRHHAVWLNLWSCSEAGLVVRVSYTIKYCLVTT